MRKMIFSATIIIVACLVHTSLFSQFSLSAQLRTRAEYRNGQGAPLPDGSKPAIFISQRSRVSAAFSRYRLKTGISLQDVRVWGQDVSTINRTTMQELNGIMLHEAWAEILLSDTASKNQSLSLKLGRQELIYDDQRLIGNLDWLQQARRHDAAVVKFENLAWKLHLGAAFNQNKENQAGAIYNNSSPGNYPGNTNGGLMYKSMQFLYAGNTWKQGSLSYLFFSDQFSKYNMEVVDDIPSKRFTSGVWSRFTTGVYFTNNFNKLNISGSAYYQFGRNYAGELTKAAMLTFAAMQQFGKLSAGAGVDYTSGGSSGTTSRFFDPLYGTPHKFWGLMDYFYAGSAFGKGGLIDYHAKLKLKTSSKSMIAADLHHFRSPTQIAMSDGSTRRKLGDELDVVYQYSLSRDIGIEAGLAHFFTTAALASPQVKNVTNVKNGANWAYVMLNIRPEILFK